MLTPSACTPQTTFASLAPAVGFTDADRAAETPDLF